MSKADTEALASLLEGSGLLEGLTGGKRSHKAQYVRWLLGNIVKRNPNARVKRGDLVHYNPPHNPPFDAYKMKEVATSERFGEVPRSKFITRMMEQTEEREPLMADIALEEGRKGLKKTKTKDQQQLLSDIRSGEQKAKLKPRVTVKKRVFKVRKETADTQRFIPGQTVPYSRLDELILFLHKQRPNRAERDIVEDIKEYGLQTSQPTVHRRIRAFKDGKIDEFGKKISS